MDKNKILEDYIGNDMKKIRKICKKIISKTNIPDGYLEEYYDKAVDVLMESMNTYDESRDCKFSTYFYGNLVRRTGTWLRDRMRFKRCNLETDSKGKIKRDEDGNPIIIPDMSINMQIDLDEDYTLENSIASDFNLEKEVGLYMNESDERVEEFLGSLPDLHRKFLELKMEGVSHQDILDKLHINEWKYNDILAKIKINEGLSVFYRDGHPPALVMVGLDTGNFLAPLNLPVNHHDRNPAVSHFLMYLIHVSHQDDSVCVHPLQQA